MKLKLNKAFPMALAVLLVVVWTLSLLLLSPHSGGQGTTRKAQANAATKTGTQQAAPAEVPTPADKTIYLTFDDGPFRYTDELLKVLADYDVKATFFVTNAHPEYRDLIAKEYKAGHAIGVHSYSHQYNKIYRSDKAFWQDFEAMDAVIYEETGEHTKLLRFPGGSSNCISAKYSKGIMTRLTEEAAHRGITYVDWNAQCGDSDGLKTGYGVWKRMVHAVSSGDQPAHIILCHDIKPYTVDAIREFIPWALKNGYHFEVLTADGYTVHHTVNN